MTRLAGSAPNIGVMSAPIVVGHDPHGADDAPLHFGIATARFTGAPLIVAAVHGGGRPAGDPLERVQARLDAAPEVSSELRVVERHSASHGLTEVLQEVNAGLGVVGATSRGAVARAVVGSTAARVIHDARCPIAVVPPGFAGGVPRTVGVAYTKSPEADQALRSGVVLAQAAGATLRVITVLHEDAGTLGPNRLGARAMQAIPEKLASQHQIAHREAVDATIAETGGEVDSEIELLYGDPVEALLGFTGSLDLLVMGSRAHEPRSAVLLGGVSRRVTAESRCPVVVLPRGAAHPLRELLARSAT
jgi:nucleotide-binding universal stress UspA family protein